MCVSCNKPQTPYVPIGKQSIVSGCNDKYEELTNIDRKTIYIFKKNKSSVYRDINKQLRIWILNLDKECPDEEALLEIKTFIEDEYSKYI